MERYEEPSTRLKKRRVEGCEGFCMVRRVDGPRHKFGLMKANAAKS